jgi:ribosomal protein S18 acetylase RimI-like enzyme
MIDNIIAVEKDVTGAEVVIKHTNTLGNCPIVPFFMKNFAELIESGFAHNFITFSNKSKAIYIEIDDQIVGHIVYDFRPDDVLKTAWIIFSCVEKGYRQRGLYNIMHRHLEETVKKAGSKKIASYVHISNSARLASCKSVGMEPHCYRMEKELD